MKIVTKIVVSTVLWTFLMLSVEGYLRLERERYLLEQDLLHECSMALMLAEPGIRDALKQGGPERARAALAALGLHDGPVRLRLVPANAATNAADGPDDDPEAHHATIDGRAVIALHRPLADGLRLEAYSPIARGDAFIHREISSLLLLMLLITVATIGSAWWFGWRFVGHKLAQMSNVVRATAERRDIAYTPREGGDELDALARELIWMHETIAASRLQIEADAQHKQHLYTQLRRADRLATVGALSSQIAHEIGTPLSVVRGRLERARQRQEAPRILAEVEHAYGQVERLEHIIRSMLDYARGASRREVAPARELCERAMNVIATFYERQGVTVTLGGDGLDASIQGNISALEQALVNLLRNAVQASRESTEVRIRVHQDAPGESVQIAVEDQGCGVSPEDFQRIFSPFFSTRARGEGTGLGLVIAVNIVQEHGGQLVLDPEYDGGARFIITLPTVPP